MSDINNNIPENEDMEEDTMILQDQDGNEIKVHVIDYFFYQGTEYAIMAEDEQDEDAEQIDCFVMQIRPYTDENGEEMEEFIQVEDAALEATLLEIADEQLNGDDTDGEE